MESSPATSSGFSALAGAIAVVFLVSGFWVLLAENGSHTALQSAGNPADALGPALETANRTIGSVAASGSASVENRTRIGVILTFGGALVAFLLGSAGLLAARSVLGRRIGPAPAGKTEPPAPWDLTRAGLSLGETGRILADIGGDLDRARASGELLNQAVAELRETLVETESIVRSIETVGQGEGAGNDQPDDRSGTDPAGPNRCGFWRRFRSRIFASSDRPAADVQSTGILKSDPSPQGSAPCPDSGPDVQGAPRDRNQDPRR